jgi:iron(III) transport system ATP-binding protein
MISVRNLEKRFPGTAAAALRDISVDIGAGLFFTLFGPSGCGKSTLLRCIAGLETPDAGDIKIDGVTVFSSSTRTFIPPNRRRIGMVFQSYAIWPHMTVLENVSFPLEAQRKPKACERARAALEIVGLAALEGRYASLLSGGQQQRVAFARAIVADPAVLLLDEPLSNLDAALRDQMRAELQSLQRRLKVTTVYVTHDQTEALSMSDRIGVIREGHIVELGTPDELYNRPRTAFTAQLIGGANIVEGTVIGAAEGMTRVDTAFGLLLSPDRGGDGVQLFIRPERIAPLAKGAAPPPNTVACTVVSRRFAGDSDELEIVPVGASDGLVLRCKTAIPLAAAPGDVIRVAIPPSDVHILAVD